MTTGISGDALLARVVNLVPELGDNTGTLAAAEQTRLLDHLNAEREKLEADLASMGEDYQLKTVDFDTVPNRSPNIYEFGVDIIAPDFKDVRYMERVIDDPTGAYDRIWPISQLLDKDNNGETLLWHDLVATGAPTRPTGYFLRDNSIQIEPISDAVYKIRLWYTKRFPAFVAGATATTWPPELNDALVYGAAAREKEFRREYEDATAMLGRAELSRQRGLSNLAYRRDDPPRIIHYMDRMGDYI